MATTSGIEYAPVDLGNRIIPLGKIARVLALSEAEAGRRQAATKITLEDGLEVYSNMTAEQICRAMWSTITMFTRM